MTDTTPHPTPPPTPPRPWIEQLADGDHWKQLDAALAWQRLAEVLEQRTDSRGNAALAWMHAMTNYRAYTLAWQHAGAASRWDPDYRRDGDHAEHRFHALKGQAYAALQPTWVNTLIAGQPEGALAPALGSSDDSSDAEPELIAAARRVLAVYCDVAGECDGAKSLLSLNEKQGAK